jgi:hypothetical protein
MDSPVPGMRVRDFYRLQPEEVAKVEEWRAIRRSAQDRLEALHVKVADYDALIQAFVIETKLRQGWQEGDAVAYHPSEHAVLQLERVDQ